MFLSNAAIIIAAQIKRVQPLCWGLPRACSIRIVLYFPKQQASVGKFKRQNSEPTASEWCKSWFEWGVLHARRECSTSDGGCYTQRWAAGTIGEGRCSVNSARVPQKRLARPWILVFFFFGCVETSWRQSPCEHLAFYFSWLQGSVVMGHSWLVADGDGIKYPVADDRGNLQAVSTAADIYRLYRGYGCNYQRQITVARSNKKNSNTQ